MNKVRIGNDIRLLVILNNTSDWDKKNIKEIKAFLVNTSIKDFEEKWHDFPGRFPRDPQSKFFRPDEHCLNRCGYPHYHAMPHDRFNHHWWHPWHMDHDPNYVFDDGFHRPFWPHPFDGPGDPHFYHGFGLEPGRWPHRWFGWTRLHDPAFGHKSPFDAVPLHIDEDWTYLAPSKEVKDSYVKDAKEGKRPNIEVFFPAQDQIACGTYKLVLVITSYNSGWGRNNLHTYTQDCGGVFELVDDETGISGDVTIRIPDGDIIGKEDIDDVKIGDIKTDINHYYLNEHQVLKLGDTDQRNNLYQIYVDYNGEISQWEPTQEIGSQLTFATDRPDVASIDQNGTITAGTFASFRENPEAIITISNSDGYKKIKVTVLDPDDGTALVGFSTAETPDAVKLDDLRYFKKGTDGKFNLPAYSTNAYLWVASRNLLKYINNDNPLDTVGVTSQRFNVPMRDGVYHNGRYWYRSVGLIVPSEMKDINIENS